MSGGHFDYKQYTLLDLSDQIMQVIVKNNIKNDWDYATNYSAETIAVFAATVKLLDLCAVSVTRIDYLLSSDDGEDTFHERLKKDIADLRTSAAKS